MRASETLSEGAPAAGVGPTPATSVGIRRSTSCRWPPRDQAWLAITALLAVTDYTERFRGGWFLLARRGHEGRPWRLAWEARMTDGTGLQKPGRPSAQPGPASKPAGGASEPADGTVRRVRAALGVLFPEAPEPRPGPASGPGPAGAARSAARR